MNGKVTDDVNIFLDKFHKMNPVVKIQTITSVANVAKTKTIWDNLKHNTSQIFTDHHNVANDWKNVEKVGMRIISSKCFVFPHERLRWQGVANTSAIACVIVLIVLI